MNSINVDELKVIVDELQDIRILTQEELVDLKIAATHRYKSDAESQGYPDGRDFAILCLLKTMEKGIA